MIAPINTIHLVFKTHFDFGFTDFNLLPNLHLFREMPVPEPVQSG